MILSRFFFTSWCVACQVFVSVLLCGTTATYAGTAEMGPLELTAPLLARTSATVLLLWDGPAEEAAMNYAIVRDGVETAHTRRHSLVADGLEPGRTYRFEVRAFGPDGALLRASKEIAVLTKPAGPVLDVRAHGAFGDGQQDDTVAIQRMIDACTKGSVVLVPAGEYCVRHLELKSDLTLHLAKGATLRFLGRDKNPLTERGLALPGPDGPVTVAFGALLAGVRTNNVSIVGEGTISGNGETWWPHAAQYRPKLFEVIDAKNLFVQGVTFEDPPMWNTHPIYVDDAVFADVTFLKRSVVGGSNGDGLDPDSCRNVLIVGCRFGNQDDSIAIKSGKLTAAQAKRQRSCEHIMVRDCRFDGTLAPGSHPLGFAIGSETCGGVRDVRVRDCVFFNAASLANIKSNRDRRHARVEDVRVENCTYVNTAFSDEPWNRAPIALDLFYYGREGEDPDVAAQDAASAPAFRDIHFRNIALVNPAGRAIYLTGLAERPLQAITFEKIFASARTGLFARNVEGLILNDVHIAATGAPFEWGKNVTNRRGDSGGGEPSR